MSSRVAVLIRIAVIALLVLAAGTIGYFAGARGDEEDHQTEGPFEDRSADFGDLSSQAARHLQLLQQLHADPEATIQSIEEDLQDAAIGAYALSRSQPELLEDRRWIAIWADAKAYRRAHPAPKVPSFEKAMQVEFWDRIPDLPASALPAEEEPDPETGAVRSMIERLLELSEEQALQTAEGRSLLTGDLKDVEAESFGFSEARVDAVVFSNPSRAAVRVIFSAPEVDEGNLYFHLAKPDGQWGIIAMRAMALPPLVRMLLDDLESKEKLSPRDRSMRDNLRLTLRSNSELRAWFKKHRKELDQFASRARKEAPSALKAAPTIPDCRSGSSPSVSCS